MEPDQNLILLKEILDNLAKPEKLNNHPWTKNHFIAEACKQNPILDSLPPGSRLIEAVAQVFQRLQPGRPPRRGLRLDTRWGEFGLLASQYFAPYRFGTPQPATMKEAWQNIDQAILLFVFGPNADVSLEDRQRYQLVGGEMEIAANSTISDWHRKGLEHLAGVLNHYENILASMEVQKTIQSSSVSGRRRQGGRLPGSVVKILVLSGLTILSLSLAWAGYNGWRIVQHLQSVKQNSQALLDLSKSFSEPAQLEKVGQTISSLRTNLQDLQEESVLLMEVAPYLGWLPRYGGDLSQAPKLLEMGLQLSITGDEVYQAVSPAIPALIDAGESLEILDLLSSLKDGGARLLTAQSSLASARSIRQSIELDKLSPTFQTILIDKVDPLLLSMQGAFPVDDVLAIARLAPRLLGAIGNGPQTYLIMVQNEDELRPTGGFLSAVGLMEFENGKLTNLSFESSELVDDFSKPYPKAPWQLDTYMMAEMLLFRDANWFTNFPTTVEWVRFLYAYSRPQAIQGVIAVDQHMLVELLRQVGPLQVEGVTELISTDNVLQYMRSAKEQKPPEGEATQSWDRKQFISRLAGPLQKKLIASDSDTLQGVIKTLIQLLDEKHILLLSDDPEMNELLARRSWDGAIHPATASDFLMVVDSNVGFNKTNAVMQIVQDYRIDLSDVLQPKAQLTIQHTNNAAGTSECIQAHVSREATRAEIDYRISDCYWSYLRIYTPAATEIIASTPHQIPAAWSLREKEIPARTDVLQEEIPGVQAFGTLLVVPTAQSLETSFTYHLPPSIITYDSQNNRWRYRLKVQKQPGTLAIPFTIHIRLPVGMKVINPQPGLLETSDGWTYTTNLQRDGIFEIAYSPDGK